MSFALEPSDFLTTRQAAELIGRPQGAIKDALLSGSLPGIHLDGSWRVARDEVLAWHTHTRRCPNHKRPAYEQATDVLAEFGSVTPLELSKLLGIHVGNARKYLAILSAEGRAHRHPNGEWFPAAVCTDQQEIAS